MGRKYTFADVSTEEKPRITQGRFVHGKNFSHKCVGRGSLGYGYSAEHAWRQWHRNWTRRYNFYKANHDRAEAYMERYEREKEQAQWPACPNTPAPKVPKTYSCNRCGTDGLHWVELLSGWRLHTPDNQLHTCYG